MRTEDIIKLTRDVEAVVIPDGRKIAIRAGTPVRITQSLGGTHTVMTDLGYLARIAGKDADALGLKPTEEASKVAEASTLSKEEIEKRAWNELRTVYDPEIPANVVDLGLVYKCEVTPHEGGGFQIGVAMTLTAPGCGMGDILKADAENRLHTIPGVKRAHVEMVVDPPWDPSKMSEAAKLQLGMM